MKTAREINENLDYLFGKINFGASGLDAKAIDIMNTLTSDIIESCADEGDAIDNDLGVAFENGFQEAKKESKILLKACFDLLKKADEAHFVEQATAITVFYHEAECDGSCLMEDIELLLEEHYND